MGVSCRRLDASQKKNTSHHMLLLSFVIILQSCYKRQQHLRTTQHITSMLLSPRNHRIPIYRFCLQTAFRARMRIFKSGISGSDATIFCNHLANSLQKIVASQKTEHMLLSATIFCIILQSCYKMISSTAQTQRSNAIFLSSCKLFAPQTKIFENRKTFRTVVLSTFQVTVSQIQYSNP